MLFERTDVSDTGRFALIATGLVITFYVAALSALLMASQS